jgi:hypothetical protein
MTPAVRCHVAPRPVYHDHESVLCFSTAARPGKVKVCSMSEMPSDAQPWVQDNGTSEDNRRPDSAVSEQSPAASSSPGPPSSTEEVGDQTPRPDSALVRGSTSKRRVDLTREFGRFLNAYLKSIVLLVTAAIAGVAALVCFPKDGPVAPSGGLQTVVMEAPFTPDAARVALTDDRSRNGIAVFAQVTSTTPQSARATLIFNVPGATWGGVNKCGPPPVQCLANGSQKTVLFGFNRSTKFFSAGRANYKQELRGFIPGIGYNAAWNSQYISATLPSVDVYLVKAGNLIHQDVVTSIAVRIPDADKYTWTSGTPPKVVGSYADWTFTSPPRAAQVNNGVSLPAQDSATKLVFIAGALLGIAGGALVGAIQEAVKPK